MLNALQINKKIIPYLDTFPSINQQNLEDSEKVLAVSVSEFYKSIAVQVYQPTPIDGYHYCMCTNRQLFL